MAEAPRHGGVQPRLGPDRLVARLYQPGREVRNAGLAGHHVDGGPGDIVWGVRWLLVPAALASLSLLIANSISISVRERRTELAVLKVLGFRPYQILLLVLGEALLVGSLAGLASAGLTFVLINHVLGGIKFPVGLMSSMYVPVAAAWWGIGIGMGTALLGSLTPAWAARNVKVAEVFSKVA